MTKKRVWQLMCRDTEDGIEQEGPKVKTLAEVAKHLNAQSAKWAHRMRRVDAQ